jgi:hypothetical protein
MTPALPPLGATPTPEGTRFAVWSGSATAVSLCLFDGMRETRVALDRDAAGVWSATVPGAGPGTRYGFRAENAAMYQRTSPDFARGDRSAFLTDYARLFRCATLNPDRSLFDHKLTLRAVLMHCGVAQPETVALLASGRCQLHPLRPDARYVDAAELEEWLLADGGPFVLKPNDGCRGRGPGAFRTAMRLRAAPDVTRYPS